MGKRERLWGVFGYCVLAAFVCLLFCSKSSPLYPINDWTDANAFFSSGKGMVAGRVMYRDLYEHKGPLLYALHALCAVFDPADFTAVFVLEVLAGALYLLAAWRLLRLYGAARAALVALPVLAALVYASFSFQQGDSAEELCLPMLAWPLFWLLDWRRTRAPRRMESTRLLMGGVLFGCVLWIKFTMIGLFAPWILGLFIFHAVRREWRQAWACVLWFAAGAMLATLPWLVYFGVNGAIGDWLKTYLYDNLFLYGGGEAGGLIAHGKAILHAIWDWLRLNPGYTLPMILGFAAITLMPLPSGKGNTVSPFEKRMIWLMALVTGLGVFIGGKAYVYYGLVLAAFAPVAAIWFCALAERLPSLRKPLGAAVLAAAVLVGGAYGYAASPNRADRFKPREQTMQYRFAAVINKTQNATLLNFGFMDAGFYTAAGVMPTVKYYHQTNVPLREMLDEQKRYVREGVTDYVVTRAELPDNIGERYALVETADAPESFWYRQVFLYKRIDLIP